VQWNCRLLPGALLLASSLACVAAEPAGTWPALSLAEPGEVELGGPVGAAFGRGVERLGQAPYTTDWLLADVSFKVNRSFTNYSGDVSGRCPTWRPAPSKLPRPSTRRGPSSCGLSLPCTRNAGRPSNTIYS